jgi:hypothetical protein
MLDLRTDARLLHDNTPPVVDRPIRRTRYLAAVAHTSIVADLIASTTKFGDPEWLSDCCRATQ